MATNGDHQFFEAGDVTLQSGVVFRSMRLAYKTYGALIADGHFEPAGFAAPLGHKDIRLILAAAEGLRVPLPLASLLGDRFLTLLAHGGDKLDWSAIGRLASKDAGEMED